MQYVWFEPNILGTHSLRPGIIDHLVPISPFRTLPHRFIPSVTNGAVLPHFIARGFDGDLLLATFVVLALVALGVLGRVDLAFLGVDA